MNFHIITLFPDAFDSYLGESILKRAIEDKKIKVAFYNPRDFSDNKFRHIDRPPYAGGPGMVIQAEPVARAVDAALKKISVKINRRKNYNTSKKPRMPVWQTIYHRLRQKNGAKIQRHHFDLRTI
jgi:tRNA (guanine37-N1)-methyltransferase